LEAVSSEYREADSKEKKRMVIKLRKTLAKLSLKEFKKLTIAPYLEGEVIEHGKDAALVAHQEYISYLKDSKKWLTEEKISELLSDHFNVNLLILTGKVVSSSRGPGKVVSMSASTVLAQCQKVRDHDKAVVLFTPDGIHYLLVRGSSKKKGGSEFPRTNSFIQKLLREVCPGSRI